LTIINIENYVDFSFVGSKFRDIDQRRTHGTVIHFHLFSWDDFFDHLGLSRGVLNSPSRGCSSNARQQFFLSLQRLVPLAFPQLFQSVSNNNFMEVL
jgi:hypothetical protein